MLATSRWTALAVSVALLTACSSTTPAAAPDLAVVSERIDQVQQSVDTWRDATTLPEAQQAADRARILITGPDVTGLDVAGSDVGRPAPVDPAGDLPSIGLLPGDDGSPGLATAVESCAGADLLGGSWADGADRWQILRTAIDQWAPDNNTFPSLPSHPQRVVGWATLTLATDDLDLAHEYSGHAQLHVDAARDALADCR